MEIGAQIKRLRLNKGLSQEALAGSLGVSCQAVSKWETGQSCPDISLLPEISVFFGVTIDDLFALTDEAHIERIDNMIWSEGRLQEDTYTTAKALLLDIAKRQPGNARPLSLLADLLGQWAVSLQAEAVAFAKQAIALAPMEKAPHSALMRLTAAKIMDYSCGNSLETADFYKTLLQKVPDWKEGYYWYLDYLLQNGLLEEAESVLTRAEALGPHDLAISYRGNIAYARGDGAEARKLWQQAIDAHPDSWLPYFVRADNLAHMGRLREAVSDYETALRIMPKPRITDPCVCASLLYEQLGDIQNAIALRQLQMTICREDYGITSGEELEEPARAIARLQQRG